VAVGYVAGARLGQLGYPSLGTTLWGVALAALPMALGLAALAAARGLPSAGAAAWGSVAWLAVGTSILGYLGWYWALARGGIARIATIQFLQPLSGLGLAVVLLGEQPTLATFGATVPIILGVVIVQRRSGRGR
jgi:drug/metabolite transporter (DMT)-like permease